MRNQLFMCLVLIAGCAHKEARTTAAPPEPKASVAVTAPHTSPGSVTQAPAICAVDADCKSHELCETGRCTDAATIAGCSSLRVHFDYDRSEIRPDSQEVLGKFARCLKALGTTRFLIAGHCDERGTEEYNVALGDRRANAVVAYLESLGAAKENLRTVSYGELQPLCGGHEESCWWRNRRADVQRESTTAAR